MKVVSIILSMLCFLFISSLGATDWAKYDAEKTDCDDKDYYVVVAVNNPEFTHTHPLSGLPCTEDVFNIQTAVDNYPPMSNLKEPFTLAMSMKMRIGMYLRTGLL